MKLYHTTGTRDAKIAWGATLVLGSVHLGALFAFLPSLFSWHAVLLCVVLHWLTGGLGICMTYHRLLTHRSFALRPKWLEYVFTSFGCLAMEGGPLAWVADHRRHHAHSDQDGDTHSPVDGFGWAHMFWWATPDLTSLHNEAYFRRWVPDLMKDKVLVWMDRLFILFPIALGIGLYFWGGWSYVVWGVFVRTVLVLHATWLVNSATHIWGYRTYKTRDHSTNLWWVALITYGEGWHNNHHAFQTSARHGLQWWEFDATYLGIRVLKFLGLAHSIKLPKSERLQAAMIDSGATEENDSPIPVEANPEFDPAVASAARVDAKTNDRIVEKPQAKPSVDPSVLSGSQIGPALVN